MLLAWGRRCDISARGWRLVMDGSKTEEGTIMRRSFDVGETGSDDEMA